MSWSSRFHHLQYDVSRDDSSVTVRLVGELDMFSRRIAEHALDEAYASSAVATLDLSRVTFIDGQGLDFLVDAWECAHAGQRSLVYRRPHRAVRRLLDLVGLPPHVAIEGMDEDLSPIFLDDDVLALCTEALSRAMRIDRTETGNIQLLDPLTGILRIVAQNGFERPFLDYFETVDAQDESACGDALKRGRSTWVPEASSSTIFAGTPTLEIIAEAGVRAVASVPIISPGGDLLAMLSTHHGHRQTWSVERRLKLETLARAAGRLLGELTVQPTIANPPTV